MHLICGFHFCVEGVEGPGSVTVDVRVSDRDTVERTVRRFKKQCERAGILADVRKHGHYENPSERRTRKLEQARRTRHRSRR